MGRGCRLVFFVLDVVVIVVLVWFVGGRVFRGPLKSVPRRVHDLDATFEVAHGTGMPSQRQSAEVTTFTNDTETPEGLPELFDGRFHPLPALLFRQVFHACIVQRFLISPSSSVSIGGVAGWVKIVLSFSLWAFT